MPQDPYSPPRESAARATPPPLVTKPARMIVFGILHIIGAVIGFVGLIVNFAQGNPKDVFRKTLGGADIDIQVTDAALAALDPVVKYTSIFVLISFLVAVPLLISGIGLLRSARWSLPLSNIYAVLSVIAKIIFLLISALVIAPAYERFFDTLIVEETSMLKLMKKSLQVGLYSSAILVIYPILSFILLNKAVVKDYLATR